MKHAVTISKENIPKASLFFKHVDKQDYCWLWTGHKNKHGYGVVWRKGQRFLAHRVSFVIHSDQSIGANDVISHSCDNTCCVNPDHLVKGSQHDNLDDMRDKGRDCKGSFHPNSKLVEKDIPDIILTYKSGGYSMNELAKQYGVGLKTIFSIIHRKRWKHVEV